MVITHHDCAYERFPSLFRKSARVMDMRIRQFAKADAIICPSDATRKDLHHFYDIPEDKTFVVYHGITKLSPAQAASRLPSEKPFLLYVSSRASYKNFDRLLSAFAAAGLKDSFDLVVVGGGPAGARDLDLVRQTALSNSVHFVPLVSDEVLASYYTRAHLLVYPSLYEGFGFPPLEAMVQGCPVLAARASCLPEICGSAAFFFDPTVEDDFVEELKRSCFDEDLRRKAIALGRDRASQFTWASSAQHTLVVDKLANNSV